MKWFIRGEDIRGRISMDRIRSILIWRKTKGGDVYDIRMGKWKWGNFYGFYLWIRKLFGYLRMMREIMVDGV